MIHIPLILRAVIPSQIIKTSLFKGFALSLIGLIFLLTMGIFFPLPRLNDWGGGIFLISICLITTGMLPFKKLSKLQMRPDEIAIENSTHFSYFSNGKKIMTIPFKSLKKIQYVPSSSLPGIAIWFAKPLEGSGILIHQSKEKIENFHKLSLKKQQADFFFPFFNSRAYDELMECLNDIKCRSE